MSPCVLLNKSTSIILAPLLFLITYYLNQIITLPLTPLSHLLSLDQMLAVPLYDSTKDFIIILRYFVVYLNWVDAI